MAGCGGWGRRRGRWLVWGLGDGWDEEFRGAWSVKVLRVGWMRTRMRDGLGDI